MVDVGILDRSVIGGALMTSFAEGASPASGGLASLLATSYAVTWVRCVHAGGVALCTRRRPDRLAPSPKRSLRTRPEFDR